MKKELDEYLVKTYPKIFADRYSDMKTTAMCWGFECNDGWYEIINTLCLNIQNYLDNDPNIPQVIASQVKEKFGGLRFYINGGDEYIYKLISNAEKLSYQTCEDCGSREKVGQTKGWIITLCEKCANTDEHGI
jgi:hypothetical protein